MGIDYMYQPMQKAYIQKYIQIKREYYMENKKFNMLMFLIKQYNFKLYTMIRMSSKSFRFQILTSVDDDMIVDEFCTLIQSFYDNSYYPVIGNETKFIMKYGLYFLHHLGNLWSKDDIQEGLKRIAKKLCEQEVILSDMDIRFINKFI